MMLPTKTINAMAERLEEAAPGTHPNPHLVADLMLEGALQDQGSRDELRILIEAYEVEEETDL